MTVQMERTDDRPTGRLSFSEVKAAWGGVSALGMSWRERPVQRGYVDYGFRIPRHPNQGQVVEFRIERVAFREGGHEVRGRAVIGEGYVVSAYADDPADNTVFANLVGTDAPA